jgi:hypothetical protein
VLPPAPLREEEGGKKEDEEGEDGEDEEDEQDTEDEEGVGLFVPDISTSPVMHHSRVSMLPIPSPTCVYSIRFEASSIYIYIRARETMSAL